MNILIIYILLGVVVGLFLKMKGLLRWFLVVMSWPVVLSMVSAMYLGTKLIGRENVD
ncbi:hypothetical protein [Providencia phage PSTCR6]|nr:hypothetical protein [Providencia phage PSTCR6]